MNLNKILVHFQNYLKFYLLISFLIVELGVFLYSRTILNHKSIQPNTRGIEYARSYDLENSEKKFLMAASFDFRIQKVHLNRAIMYYNLNKFSEAEEILKNLEDSHFFYRESYEVRGQNSFAWGKSLLDSEDCSYSETVPLWDYALKKFSMAKYLSIFQLDSSSYTRNSLLAGEVKTFMDSLPGWRENCLHPPESKNEGVHSKSKNSNSEKKSREEIENAGEPHTAEEQSGKSVLQKKRDGEKGKKEKEREVKKAELSFDSNEEKALENAREELKTQNSYKEGEYTRFREEIYEVRDLDVLREIMQGARW